MSAKDQILSAELYGEDLLAAKRLQGAALSVRGPTWVLQVLRRLLAR
jgi:hypothetical protein